MTDWHAALAAVAAGWTGLVMRIVRLLAFWEMCSQLK